MVGCVHHDMFTQEIYRPGTAISDASNLCTAVGGNQNKEFRGKTSIWGGKGGIRYIDIGDMNNDYKGIFVTCD